MAGFLYLIYMVTHIISDVWRRSVLLYSEMLQQQPVISWLMNGYSRIAAVGDLLAAALFFLAAWAFYVLLKPVNKNLALLFLLLNLAVSLYSVLVIFYLFACQLLLSGADYLKVFQADQLQALAMFFLDLHEKGFLDRPDIFWRLALSAWLFGFQVGLPSQNFGHRADGSLFYLAATVFQFFLSQASMQSPM